MNQEWTEFKMQDETSWPIPFRAVLVYSPTGCMGVAALMGHAGDRQWFWSYRRISGSSIAHDITHWMPLPPVPGRRGVEPGRTALALRSLEQIYADMGIASARALFQEIDARVAAILEAHEADQHGARERCNNESRLD